MFEAYSWHDKLPDESLEVYEPYLRLFFETMYERQMIWKRRFIDGKDRPWTEDKFLRDFKFTNVYRELDRSSQYQIKTIMLDDSLNLTNLVWKLMVYRFFNNPETFSSVHAQKWKNGIPDYNQYNEDEFAEFVAAIRRDGKNPFTTAYLINSMAAPKKSRDYCYTRVTIPALHAAVPKIIAVAKTSKSPEELISFLLTLPSVAGFIAHEFYQDFTYLPRYTGKTLMRWTQNDFTNVGPGASVGIRLIFPNLVGKEQKEAIYRLKEMAKEQLDAIAKEKGEPMPYLAWNAAEQKYYTTDECNITLHQIEMWLCEFQKYWKMIIGEGKQRSKFSPQGKTAML
jgi:hypothetical protein